jgi:AraC-like DNA-binding protein
MKKNYTSELSGQFMYCVFHSKSEKRQNRFRQHFHTETELGFMLGGEGVYMIGDKRHSAAKEDLFIVRSNEQHCLPTVTEELTSVNLYLSSYFLWHVCSDYISPKKIQALINGEISIENKQHSRRISECYERIIPLFESDDPEARFALRGEVLQLIIAVADGIPEGTEDSTPSAARFADIQRSILFIRENYSRPIGLKDIAKSAAMSSSYFSGTFKKVTGMAPYNFLITIRIEKAVELLRETDMSVMDISLACGFTSLTSFNKAFKSLVGLSPTKYRSIH